VVEFHTGRFAHLEGEERAAELRRIADAAALAAKNGIEPHAGHGLSFDNVAPIAAIPHLAELNIGHFLVGEAIFTGLDASVRRMRALMDEARGWSNLPASGRGVRAPARNRHDHRHGSDLCNIERIQIARTVRGALHAPRLHRGAQAKAAAPFTRAGTYAKRFAAKEAFSKAVGTGFARRVHARYRLVNKSWRTGACAHGRARKGLTPLPPKPRGSIHHNDRRHPFAMAVVVISAIPEGK
jgi:phosphopantetheinyl transferase (holo-ACP synthase)